MSAADKSPADRVDEVALRAKLLSVPAVIVEKALLLYVILTDRLTPVWVRALVAATLIFLINPWDAIPDVIPGVGLADDLALIAVTLERLSRFVTPTVKLRAKRLAPTWLARENDNDSQTNNKVQGVPDNGKEKEVQPGRRRVPFLERFRILP